jgi:hypothetical protein
MACSRFKGFVGVLIAGSMVVSSTAAVAASSTAPTATPATQIDPWVALTAMSGGATAAALCGAAAVAAAAQAPGGCVLPALDAAPVAQVAPPQPIPVPPVEGPSGLAFDPLLLALGALAAAALIYFLVRHHHHHNEPNSPA